MDCGCSFSLRLTSFSKSLAFQVLGTTCWNLSEAVPFLTIFAYGLPQLALKYGPSLHYSILYTACWTEPGVTKPWSHEMLPAPCSRRTFCLEHSFPSPGHITISSAQLNYHLLLKTSLMVQLNILSILRILTTLCILLSSFVLWLFVSYFVLLYRRRLSAGRDD